MLTEGYTAVTAGALGSPPIPALGTDGKYHVVYELLFQNASAIPATLTKLEVLDAVGPLRVLASYSGSSLVAASCDGSAVCNRLRSLWAASVADPVIAPSESRLLYVDFALDTRAQVPHKVLHRLSATMAHLPGARDPKEAVPVDYVIAPLPISTSDPVTIGPPVHGVNWVAGNGCCEPRWPHRTSVQALNGALRNPQRFAIDWMQMDGQGRFVRGDKTKNESYTSYGQSILAVADGTVIEILDGIATNAPGILPAHDPILRKQLTPQNVEGNHIVLDLGGGVYAFYAHLIPGSLRVKKGDRVKKRQELARLGNTGNSNAAHLHFHLSDSQSPLGGNGLPYVIEQLSYSGQIDMAAWDTADDYLQGTFFRLAVPGVYKGESRLGQLPMAWSVIGF